MNENNKFIQSYLVCKKKSHFCSINEPSDKHICMMVQLLILFGFFKNSLSKKRIEMKPSKHILYILFQALLEVSVKPIS